MDVKPFYKPVKFMVGARLIQHVTSTEQALDFMENKWPWSPGPALKVAVQRCKDAIAGKAQAEAARSAFVLALSEGLFEIVE